MSDDRADDEPTIPEGLVGDQPDFDDEDLEIIDGAWDRLAPEGEADERTGPDR